MLKVIRNTQEELIMLKKNVLDKHIQRELTRKDAANLLQMHPNAVSRLKKRYKEHGIAALMPQKPGPKAGTEVMNRTSKKIEDIVVALALKHPSWGPIPLAEELNEEHEIFMDQTTVWRILKRRKIRYTREYKRWKKDPTLYCLDKPGIELQMDGCYPYGRQRKLVQFDAIDDCSRWVYAKIYEHEDAESAIDFVSHLVRVAPFRIERIRVDNRYGKRLRLFCEILGIVVIENDPYTPEQNGKIERFHKTAKREFYWRKCSFYDSIEVHQYKLTLWLGHYNTKRKHSGYGMNRLTPYQKIAKTTLQLFTINYPQSVTLTLQQYKI